jgi:formylglycine-generating enzyme required for sulfatase activity
MNKHIILKIMVDVILGRKCSRLGGKVALIIVFSLLILVSCSSKEDDSQAEVDQQQTSQQLQLIDQLVCDTIIELPTAARKPFRSHFITMVRVEGGRFTFGNSEYRFFNNRPCKEVDLPAFYISKYEVTQALWKQVMDTNPSEFKGDNLPVEHVSWLEAVEFCNRLSEREGLAPAYRISPGRVSCNFQAEGYRLPTEEEWEFAARGGIKSKGYYYSGGNDLNRVAWNLDNSGEKSHPVGRRLPNELGLHDMSGNVWEWCWDWYNDSHSSHTIRGGSWYSMSNYYFDECMVGERYYYFEPETWEAVIPVGIRVCRSQ